MRLTRHVLRKGAIGLISVVITLMLMNSLEVTVRKRPAGPPTEHVPLQGYHNDGAIGDEVSCADRLVKATLAVQPSIYLHDNLTQAVHSLQHYPKIREDYQKQDLPFEEWVAKNWAELSGSAVWMAQHRAHLLVTRLIYYPTGNLGWPSISFARGRLYDAAWQPLDGHAIEWQGEQIGFPRVFDIPSLWLDGGSVLGAEDPRIIVEDGVPDAEPVIVFNMMEEHPTVKRRGMWIHRPFSRRSTPLTIRDEEAKLTEKNWAPFFRSPDPTTPSAASASPSAPSTAMHLIYSLHPLRILRCDLPTGQCDWDYEQDPPPGIVPDGPHVDGDMRGGTNFVPIHLSPAANGGGGGLQLWASFPRTHLDGGCNGPPMYRPELLILASPAPSEYYVVYSSDAFEFGGAVLEPAARDHPCGEGHILIPNAIASWDQRPRHDVMTLSVSVADHTIQVVKVYGVRRLVDSLPVMRKGLLTTGFGADGDDGGAWADDEGEEWEREVRWSAAGKHVLECSVSAARNTSLENIQLAGLRLAGEGEGEGTS